MNPHITARRLINTTYTADHRHTAQNSAKLTEYQLTPTISNVAQRPNGDVSRIGRVSWEN
jgi:hypothetical protein